MRQDKVQLMTASSCFFSKLLDLLPHEQLEHFEAVHVVISYHAQPKHACTGVDMPGGQGMGMFESWRWSCDCCVRCGDVGLKSRMVSPSTLW